MLKQTTILTVAPAGTEALVLEVTLPFRLNWLAPDGQGNVVFGGWSADA